MLQIVKNWNKHTHTYDISIKNFEKELRIVFSGALDLHWIFINKGCLSAEDMTFEITKENYFLYSLFEKLFSDIKDMIGYEVLYHNGIIEWHCDDNPYDEANVVYIRESKDKFKIDFKFKSKEFFKQGGVRFRNSGSSYYPFNNLFMDMYHGLQEYDTKYHQIHIEEYLYHKNIK